MEHSIRSVEHRIAIKKLEIMKKDLNKMDNEVAFFNLKINNINNSFKKLLLKDKPVGNSIKAVRYIRNECNNYN